MNLNDIMTQMDLAFHPNKNDSIFFSAPPVTFSKIDKIFSHKASLNRYRKKHEITHCILSDHQGLINTWTSTVTETIKSYKLMEIHPLSTQCQLSHGRNKKGIKNFP